MLAIKRLFSKTAQLRISAPTKYDGGFGVEVSIENNWVNVKSFAPAQANAVKQSVEIAVKSFFIIICVLLNGI